MTTPYRNVREALEHREAELTRTLESLERARTELSQVSAQIEETRVARDQTRESLARLASAPATARTALESLRIASPCPARWDDMKGNEQVRFCGGCRKNVYNLSAMDRDEAEGFVAAQEGKVCVRFFKRADGTVMTQDCPVGARRRIGKRVALVVLGGGALAAAALATTGHARMGEPGPAYLVQGGATAPIEAPAMGVTAVPVQGGTGEPVPMMGEPPPMPPHTTTHTRHETHARHR